MKTSNKILIAIPILILIVLSSFKLFSHGPKNFIETTHNLQNEEFSEIVVSAPGNLYITQSDTYSFRSEAEEGAVHLVDAEIKDGVLYLKPKEITRNYKDLKMHVSLPELKGLIIDGSNNIYSEGMLKGSSLLIEVNGSATLEGQFDYTQIQVEINGSGTLTMAGKADIFNIEINGAGNIKSYELLTTSTVAEINGVGKCKLFAAESLEIEVNGTGSVSYKGKPKSTSFSKNGIAAIKSAD